MNSRWRILQGDVRDRLADVQREGVPFDAVLCDPPYELGFMGKRWDSTGIAFSVDVWQQALECLRPGAHLMAFGGTRTYHRMTCAIEDAGFEIRDCLSWLYGSGFPKSLDIAKAIDKAAGHWRGRAGAVTIAEQPSKGTEYERTEKGPPVTAAAAAALQGWGTALKPAWEPCVLARKPVEGTVAANAIKHGTGGLAIDSCRLGSKPQAFGNGKGFAPGEDLTGTDRGGWESVSGRWPANVVLAHLPECRVVGQREVTRPIMGNDPTRPVKSVGFTRGSIGQTVRTEVTEVTECADGCPVRMLDEQSGDRPGMSGGGQHRADYAGGMFGGIDSTHTARGDSGGASRFFYTAKVSTSERNDGLDDLPELTCVDGREPGAAGAKHARAGANGSNGPRNPHPTMKPVALTEYFARLLLPPRGIGRPRRILVPFSGVGSEMLGALRAGWDDVVGIELSPEYAEIARVRLSRVDTSHQEDLFAGQTSLFGKAG